MCHGCGIDENFHLFARCCHQPSRQHLQPLLDDVVIVVALRIGGDCATRALFEKRERILIGSIVDAEHDDRAHAGPQHARVHPPFGLRREPVHVAMRAGIEEFAEIFAGIADRVGIGHADAVEAERGRFARERRLQIGTGEVGALVQKSRST